MNIKLTAKGVNVTEIEEQTKTNEDKIAELDKKLEAFRKRERFDKAM